MIKMVIEAIIKMFATFVWLFHSVMHVGKKAEEEKKLLFLMFDTSYTS